MAGAAKVIMTETDLSARVAAKRGVYLAAAAPLIRGPIGRPFIVTSPEEFLARTTPDGKIASSFDRSYLEIQTALQFTDKIWLSRASRNAMYGAAYIRAANASGPNFPAEQGFTDPTAGYDLNTVDGRPVLGETPVTVDADQEYLTVTQAFFDACASGDAVVLTSSGTAPVPTTSGTTYYIFKSEINRKVGLGPSQGEAVAGHLIDFTSFGIGTHTLTFAAKTNVSSFTASTSDILTVTNPFFAMAATGDSATLTTDGTLPAGTSAGPTYYVIKTGTPGQIKLALNRDNATSGIAMDIQSTGAGNHTITMSNKALASTATVDMSDDTFTIANGSWFVLLKTGDAVKLHTDTGTLPGGTDTATTYYVTKFAGQKIKLATTSNNAINNVNIAIDDPGVGTITLSNESIVPQDSSNEKALLIYGADPGLWNSGITVKLTNYATNPTKVKEPESFLLEVFYNGKLVDSLLGSRDPAKRDLRNQTMYIEDVAKRSNFIRVIDNIAIAASIKPKDQLTPLALANGTDGDAITDSLMIEALRKFDTDDEFPIAVVTDLGWATPGYQQSIVDLCESRGDCAFVFSAPFEVEAAADFLQAIVDYKTVTLNSVSSYGGMWTSHLLVNDVDNNREVYIAPSAHVAGKIAYVWDQFEPWVPAAGNKRGNLNVLGVHRIFTSGQMDVLYDNSINPIRWKRGKGTTIWGQKTLQTRPSDLDRMNARLLLCVIKPAIKELLEDYLFDLLTVENNTGTRAAIKARIQTYMNSVKNRNGVYDFQVICDDRNNSDSDVENNTIRVWLLVKIIKSVEYIPFDIGVTPYGMDFDLAASLL